MLNRKRTLAALLCALLATAASAEEAAESSEPSKPSKPAERWSRTGELSYLATSGNTSTETIGGAMTLEYQHGDWSAKAGFSYVRSETDGELAAEKLVGDLGFRWVVRPELDLYARTKYLKNEFAGIGSRNAIDLGLLYQAIESDRLELDLSAGVGYTDENRIAAPDRAFAMATLSSDLTWRLSANAELSDELRLNASFDDGSDWRLSNLLALDTAINSIFSIKLSHGLEYQNDPVPGFGRSDTVSSIALVAKF